MTSIFNPFACGAAYLFAMASCCDAGGITPAPPSKQPFSARFDQPGSRRAYIKDWALRAAATEPRSKTQQRSLGEFTPQFSGSFACPVPSAGKDSEGRYRSMVLQESPRGLAYHFDVDLTTNPNRIRAGWHDGVARQVCDGVFTDTITEHSDPQNGKPVVLTFISESEGGVRVSVQGSVENNPYFSYSDFAGVYRRQRTKSEFPDPRFSEAISLCAKWDTGTQDAAPRQQMAVFQRAAHLLKGGDALALALCDAAATDGKSASLIRDIWCARQGDRYAMKSVFGWLGGGCGRINIDPAYALDCYESGRKCNADFAVAFEGAGESTHKDEPSLAAISYEAKSGSPFMLEIAKHAHKCGPIDAESLFAKRGVLPAEWALSRYGMWNLAEEASAGGRFGAPNQQLALQLIVRGNGELPEIAKAAALFDHALKTRRSEPVKVLSLIGVSEKITSSAKAPKTASDATVKKAAQRLALREEWRPVFDSAFAASFEFASALAMRASNTRGFCFWPQSRAAFLNNQLDAYLQTVESIRSGFTPARVMEFDAEDYQLSVIYAEVLLWLRFEQRSFQNDTGEVDLFYFDSTERLRALQRLWIKHRDASARLFHALNSDLTEEGWKAWLTRIRTLELISLLEQSGVRHGDLDALRERKHALEKEYFNLYEQYQQFPGNAFAQGLVRSGISNPAVMGKKIPEQLQRLTQETLAREPEIDWRKHGAFALIYQLRAWISLLERTVNFSEAVLRCNPEDLGSDPCGYYEDFEGGAVCLFREGDRYAVSAGCVRPLMSAKLTLSFSGKLKDDVINGEASSGAEKRRPRLLVGRGMICLEPNSDGPEQALANTYVRVGIVNDAGKNRVRSFGAYGAFESNAGGEISNGFSSAGLKKFTSRKYPADLNQAASESHKLLQELLTQD